MLIFSNFIVFQKKCPPPFWEENEDTDPEASVAVITLWGGQSFLPRRGSKYLLDTPAVLRNHMEYCKIHGYALMEAHDYKMFTDIDFTADEIHSFTVFVFQVV